MLTVVAALQLASTLGSLRQSNIFKLQYLQAQWFALSKNFQDFRMLKTQIMKLNPYD